MGLLFGLSRSVADVLRPRRRVPTVEWASQRVILPQGSEIRGKVRFDLFPHAIEPLACFDDPYYREIDLQWASRLGKTQLALCALAKTAATDPDPMAFADADEKSLRRVFRRLWRVLEKIPDMAELLPPRHLRSTTNILLTWCQVYGAWSGSATTAADYAARIIVLNEIDKMSKRKSDEADFAELMVERAKGFVRWKVLRMSTPSYKGRSRIEAARLAGDNRARLVPCPFCNHFQLLEMGDRERPGGLKWPRDSRGRSDLVAALKEAWYECVACRRKILDEHRYEMLNSGVWVPEGMRVEGSGRLVGTPQRPGPHASFGPLSTLHSLLPSITWGVIAHKWLESCRETQKRRNFINSWEALTYDDAPPNLATEEMLLRLCPPEYSLRIVPTWVRFLTVGIDVQEESFWWVVCGWGNDGRGILIDYGSHEMTAELTTLTMVEDAFELFLKTVSYPRSDGRIVRPRLALADSGTFTERVYAFCRRVRGLWPSKGHNRAFAEGFRITSPDGDPDAGSARHKVNPGGLNLVIVNTERTQKWLQEWLQGTTEPSSPHGFVFPAECAVDAVLFEQLLNEYATNERNDDGYELHTWKKRGPNEYRDAIRYARTAAMVITQDGKLWGNLPEIAAVAPTPAAPTQKPVTTPDGRAWLITNR